MMVTAINQKLKLEAIRSHLLYVLEKNEDRCLYNTVVRLHRLEKNIKTILDATPITQEEKDLVQLLLYIDSIHNATNKQTKFDIQIALEHSLKTSKKICEKFRISEETQARIEQGIQQLLPGVKVVLPEAQVYQDAIMMEFSGLRGRDHLRLAYEEMILRDINIPESNWYDILIGMIENMSAATEYGKTYVQPNLEKLTRKLQKEKKAIKRRTSLILEKELDIKEGELNKLRKKIGKHAKRDERAIQTLFRTTIKNHYTLNEMVDRKANIMITVNSIILSVVMSGILGSSSEFNVKMIPMSLFSITSIISIIFAIFAIRPFKTQGDFSEEEVRAKKGNLLYFGNFHNMQFRDFEWGFLQMLNDKNYLYASMIRDFYYQGLGLDRKYKFIRRSLSTFLFGVAISFALYLIIQWGNFFLLMILN